MAKWASVAVFGGLWVLAGLTPVSTRGADTDADKKAVAARWCDLTPLATEIAFENVRYPHLNARGEVTFIADDPMYTTSKGTNHGIYRSQTDGKLDCLVRGGETTVPGTEVALKLMRGLQMDENGVDFIFNGVDNDQRRGLYRWSKGQLETVARTGTTILPGEQEPLRSIEYGAWQGTHILYEAITAKRSTVLVLHDVTTGSDRIVCRTGMAIPGHDDATFRFIGEQNWITGDSIIFRAASAADPNKADTKGTMGVYGWFGIKDWTADSEDLAPGRLRTVANGETAVTIPGLPGTSTLERIGNTPIDGNTTAFWASGEGFQGIFVSKTPTGPVRCLASTHTRFGGPFEGVFTAFGTYPTVIGQNVIFTADAQEGDTDEAEDDDGAADANNARAKYTGVFVYRLDRGELYTLADDRSKLDGKDIAGFETGGHFMVNDQFAVTVKFKDRTSRVYRGTIRPEAYRQLLGSSAAATPKPAEPAR